MKSTAGGEAGGPDSQMLIDDAHRWCSFSSLPPLTFPTPQPWLNTETVGESTQHRLTHSVHTFWKCKGRLSWLPAAWPAFTPLTSWTPLSKSETILSFFREPCEHPPNCSLPVWLWQQQTWIQIPGSGSPVPWIGLCLLPDIQYLKRGTQWAKLSAAVPPYPPTPGM